MCGRREEEKRARGSASRIRRLGGVFVTPLSLRLLRAAGPAPPRFAGRGSPSAAGSSFFAAGASFFARLAGLGFASSLALPSASVSVASRSGASGALTGAPRRSPVAKSNDRCPRPGTCPAPCFCPGTAARPASSACACRRGSSSTRPRRRRFCAGSPPGATPAEAPGRPPSSRWRAGTTWRWREKARISKSSPRAPRSSRRAPWRSRSPRARWGPGSLLATPAAAGGPTKSSRRVPCRGRARGDRDESARMSASAAEKSDEAEEKLASPWDE